MTSFAVGPRDIILLGSHSPNYEFQYSSIIHM